MAKVISLSEWLEGMRRLEKFRRCRICGAWADPDDWTEWDADVEAHPSCYAATEEGQKVSVG